MLSLHIIADNAPQERLDRAVAYLKRTKQPYVNIAGGSQIDRAMQLVERVQSEVPGIQVFWRVLQDTGNIFSMSASQWWNERILPRLKWMQDHKVIMVIDNESSGDDAKIMAYVQNSMTRMYMLHDVGLGGAFCRFATGNIQEHQYPLLKPLLDKLTDKDWISPNEYSNLPGKSSGGHLERWKRIQAVTSHKLKFAIGECGVLNDYRANDGYRPYLSGSAMAAQLFAEEIWYNNGAIPRFIFCIGGYGEWNSLQVGDDALEYLEAHYAAHPIVKPPPVIEPIPPIDPPAPPETITVPRLVLETLRDAMEAQLDIISAILNKK